MHPKQKQVTLSIVIPAYNEELALPKCLDAIAAQTVKPDEVIVVDNNSTDNTAAVVQQYPFVTLLAEKHHGCSFARIRGYDACRSDIIASTDADMILPADWVERIVQFYELPEHKDLAWTSPAPGYLYNLHLPRLSNSILYWLNGGVNRLTLRHANLWGSSMAMLRSQWQHVSSEVCRRADINEDVDLSIHLHGHGVGIYADSRYRLRAKLNRLYTDRAELWPFLLMWPRTLRLHRKKGWLAALIVVLLVRFIAAPMQRCFNRIAHFFGLTSFSD